MSSKDTESKDQVLIKLVKNKCYITDTSDLTNNRIKTIMEDALIKVSEMIGISGEYDFSKPGKERELYLNYCFYMWNDKSITDFEDNYISDICKARSFYEINANLEQNEEL